MTFITELKQRPEEERVAFAATAAISVVVLLIVLWITTIFVSGRLATTDVEVNGQAASAVTGLSGALEQTGDAINSVTEQYKELQNKTGSVGAQAGQGFATSTMEEAVQNFMKIRYDEEGNMYIEEDSQKSLLDEIE